MAERTRKKLPIASIIATIPLMIVSVGVYIFGIGLSVAMPANRASTGANAFAIDGIQLASRAQRWIQPNAYACTGRRCVS